MIKKITLTALGLSCLLSSTKSFADDRDTGGRKEGHAVQVWVDGPTEVAPEENPE